MKTKAVMAIMAVLFLLSMILVQPTTAMPDTFYTVGTATAEWSTEQKKSGDYSVKLYVEDGTQHWAEVSIPVDIVIEDIAELTFWEYIESYTTGWDVNVVLGVDCDGDGFEADVAGWHVPSPGHDPSKLGDDSFVEMDGTLGSNPPVEEWHEIDALGTAQWWTPNSTGDSFASFYGDFASFLDWLDTGSDDSRIDKDDTVKVIKLLIGGSSSWMGETAYVDYVILNDAVVLDEPGVEDAITLLEDLKAEINELSSQNGVDLKKPAAKRKATLMSKVNEVIAKVDAEDYKGAMMKLKKDIRPKLDGKSRQTWATHPLTELLEKIDFTIDMLKTL